MMTSTTRRASAIAGTARLSLIIVVLLLLPRPVSAQGVSVRGTVLHEDGSRARDAVVQLRGTLQPPAASAKSTQEPATRRKVALAQRVEPDGTFEFTALQAGTYHLLADAVATERGLVARSQTFELDKVPLERNLVLGARERRTRVIMGTLGALLAYLLVLLAFRRHNIVRPARELLLAQVQSVITRLNVEVGQSFQVQAGDLRQDLLTIISHIQGLTHWKSTSVFWSQGEELAAWRRVHEAERQLSTIMAPPERVLERVHVAEVELRGLALAEATTLAERMRATLDKHAEAMLATPPNQVTADALLLRAHHQLAEALSLIYGDRDTKFAALMEWQNKAMWLTAVSILLVAAVSIAFGHEWLLLVGAAGGLVSRLTRTLFRQDVPNDYGASWSTIFLSPLLGAVAAWFGVVLLVGFRELNILGGMLAKVAWPPDFEAATIGVAFVLGFSERFLNTLLSAVEGKLPAQTPATAPPAGTPNNPSGVPTRNPPRGGLPAGPDGDGVSGMPEAAVTKVMSALGTLSGERVVLHGVAKGLLHEKLVSAVGTGKVEALDNTGLAGVAPANRVLVHPVAAPAVLSASLEAIANSVLPKGRLVVIGSTPSAQMNAPARPLKDAPHSAPAVVREAFTQAGFEPDGDVQTLTTTDPATWSLALMKK